MKYFLLIILCFSVSSFVIAREVSTDSTHAMVFEVIQDQISFNKADIARASLLTNEDGSYKGLLIQLKPYAAEELERMTKTNVGKKVTIVFRQRILSSSLIQTELGSDFLLNSISKEDAMNFIKMLNTGK